ncbi:MAG: PepSY domain-containing protein [Alkalibacterium sp.]|nr:PepSY domain-containing protein [Alkalibacterium sp.]
MDDTEPVEEQPDDTGGETDDMDGTDDSTMDDTDDIDEVDEPTSAMDTPGVDGLELPVTLNSSIDIFYETFGSEEINIDSIHFEEDDGRYVYSFEGWDDNFDYELDVDAETSEIIEQEQDEDSDTEDILELEGIITPQEAMEAALEASGSGYVEEWELEVENGQTIYDIDIEDGNDQKIDAMTGDVL